MYDAAQSPSRTEYQPCAPIRNCGGRYAESWSFMTSGTSAVAGMTRCLGAVASV
jgi:hypothetical protein